MTELNCRPFTASVTYDLAMQKEVRRYIRYQKPVCTIVFYVIIFYFLFFQGVPPQPSACAKMLLMRSISFIAANIIVWLLNRNGGVQYKRMLIRNGGKPGVIEYIFLQEGIRWSNSHTGGSQVIPYTQIHAIFETPNYLVLRLEHNIFESIDKRTICGGPVRTFIQCLLAASPNIKKKKLKSPLPGKISERVFALFITLMLVLGILLSDPVQHFLPASGDITANMSYAEIAQELESLGIHDIPDETLRDLASWDQEYDSRFPQNGMYKCTNLLYMAGMGTYDEEAWTWTPAQTGVFWFDAEAFTLTEMYTNLLLGIQGVNPEVLRFTDIKEDLSFVNPEEGTGVQSVSFTFEGKEYTLSAHVMYDWYDLEFLNQLNRIIREETGNSLYFAWDQGQGYLVFYGDAAWASRFQKATGILLKKNILYLDTLY